MSGELPRASSYSREILQRLRTSAWEQRYVMGAVIMGQFLSLCLCGTGVTSELLVTDHDISVPTTQCFMNYLLLASTFGIYFSTRKRFLTVIKYNWWKYLVLGVIDVEANFLFTLAYCYTNLTSIQLLDCFTIAVVMVLSYVFLKTRYKLINIMGVLLTMIGIACLVLADLNSPRNNGGSAKLLGDMLCLVGAILYAAGNVCQEYLVKSHSIVEYLGLIGIVGSFVSGAQLIGLERMKVARIQWSPPVGGLFAGFGFTLFLFSSITPWVIRMSSAVVFNLSILTADFYVLLFGIFLFNYSFSGFYILGFCLVVMGIFIYNLKHPVERKLRERSKEQRKERSIERMYSVATTKADSSTKPGDVDWKMRGLLESSTESSSASIGILSQSYKMKAAHYGTTEMKVPTILSPLEHDKRHSGPVPFWGGRRGDGNYRDSGYRGSGYRGHWQSAHVEMESSSESIQLLQSVPSGRREEGEREEGGGEGDELDGMRRHSSVRERGGDGVRERGGDGVRERGGDGARERGGDGARERGGDGARERGGDGARERGGDGARERGGDDARERGGGSVRERGGGGDVKTKRRSSASPSRAVPGSGREGEPEGKEERNYSRQGGVGEEGGGDVKRGRVGEVKRGGEEEQRTLRKRSGDVTEREKGRGVNQRVNKRRKNSVTNSSSPQQPLHMPSGRKRQRRHSSQNDAPSSPQSHRKEVNQDRAHQRGEGEGRRKSYHSGSRYESFDEHRVAARKTKASPTHGAEREEALTLRKKTVSEGVREGGGGGGAHL